VFKKTSTPRLSGTTINTRSLLFFLLFQPDSQVHGGVEFVHLKQDFLGLGDLFFEVEDAVDLHPEPEVELGHDGAEQKLPKMNGFENRK
jgi:hypothetical protein